jgi:hypothetical protein
VGSNPTLSAIPIFIDKLTLFCLCYVLLRYFTDLSEA